MSTSYYAHTLIGVRVPIDKLYRKEVILHTAHPYPEGATYCPTCGVKLADVVRMVPLFDEFNFKIGKFDVEILNNAACFVGLDTGVSDWGKTLWDFRACRRMAHIEKELREELQPRGMWDEGLFGIYTFLKIS